MSAQSQPQRLYLLGHPISHSPSPLMYRAVYERLGLPWSYELADLPSQEQARAFIEEGGFLSINVTTPYKPLAFAAAGAKAASAKLAQGANVVVSRQGVLAAFNTDGQGFVSYLERRGFRFDGARVAVCGTGPTALSILHACSLAGAELALLVGRDKERARRALEGYVERCSVLATATIELPPAQTRHRSLREAFKRTVFKFGSYATSTKALAAADLVVNATTLGMRENDAAPFDVALFHAGQTAFDAVYGHGETAFMRGAREAGCTAWDGAGMLVGQALATVHTVCDLADVELDLADEELFTLMAKAAGFEGLLEARA